MIDDDHRGSRLRKILGQRGLTAMKRLMGMVLVALAVQMFVEGLRTALNSPVT